MKRWLMAVVLTASLIGTAPAGAITPVIPPPPYTAEELAGLKARAQAGDAAAQSTLGRTLTWGLRTAADIPQGLHWLNLAAAQNDGAAEEALGQAYLDGKGVTASKPEALEWFQRAVAHGQSSANGWATELAAARDHYVKLQAAAQTGDAAAEYAFAHNMTPERTGYYGHGWGDDDAVKWYRLSAVQGYAAAESWMGFYYLMGYLRDRAGPSAPHAVWENDDADTRDMFFKAQIATGWYEKAAAQGDAEAIHTLPVAYNITRGYDKDQMDAKLRAAAWRDPPSGAPSDSHQLWTGWVAQDLIRLCAWYDGRTVVWPYGLDGREVSVIIGRPQPDKALACYQHQADVGLDTGAYVFAYRTDQAEAPGGDTAETAYRKAWDTMSGNGGLATRAAAHLGLKALARKDRATAYAWLTVAGEGNMTIYGPPESGIPDEPDLAGRVSTALAGLRLSGTEKASGDQTLTALRGTHPPPPPPVPLPPPPSVY